MPTIENMRQQILQKLLDYAEKKLSPKKLNLMRPFIEQYYANTSLEDLAARTIKNLFGALMSHWELMYQRQPGERKRRIFNPDPASDGWETSHTVIQYILDDQPFLVDTLTTEINRQGLTVHFMVHLGGMKLIRNAKNQITKVLSLEFSNTHTISEAPIYIEIDKHTNPAALEKLGHDLDRVLEDAQKAVRDWKKMESEINRALSDLEKNPPSVTKEELGESKAFLKWLLDHHFTFLGFRAYAKVGTGKKMGLKIIPNSSLGVLSNTSNSRIIRYYSELPTEARKLAESNQIIELAKTNTLSTVHGRRYTDFVSVKYFNKEGAIIGERWFVGLYTSSVYVESPSSIPLIRLKVLEVLRRSGLPKNGHAYKALTHILETLPRDDLFHANTDELFTLGMGILQLQDRRCIRMFTRKDIFGRFISCLVYVPRDDFNMELCYRLQDILLDAFHGLEISYTTTFFDAILARIHFTIRIDPKHPQTYDLKAIETKLIEAGWSWKDLLHKNLIQVFGEEKGNALALIFGRAFPASYKENYSALEATSDIKNIEKLSEINNLELNLYRTENMPQHMVRLKLFHLDETIPLSDAIPILEKMGLRVISEQPHHIQPKDKKNIWINDFLMQVPADTAFDLSQKKELFEQAFKKIWSGEAEDDGFNSLVISANLNWREIAVLRAHAKYLKQIGFTFSQDYMEVALSRNPNVVYLLIQLFHCRFDPTVPAVRELLPGNNAAQQQVVACSHEGESRFSPLTSPHRGSQIKKMVSLEEQIDQSLDKVDNLDQDRILRMFWNLIQAIVRTNFFQTDALGNLKPYLSFKFNPEKVRDLPLPSPEHEIFVYSPAFEGLHLRANKVARGGIRWSDRREDFRREVLGLMKAQQVKNAIIVPAGAKGGFVTKLPPADCNRETQLQIGINCYQNFIRGLLDLTDNLIEHHVVKPENTVCHDDHDTYLVVAADKGTATFSDIANGISKEYNFWLGDAFASGGSTGYDHKKIGITARGAWESVTQHFQEIERDINQPFTVTGIGDMAGDVFGNGMLQSAQIKLVAAFNNLHIFLDPDPDPTLSYAERKRLFNLSRSTWQDYDPELISKGGGVFSRALKTIKLSPEIKALLNCKKDQLAPNELIQTILKAPVDLLWNGGIGTFVKSSKETHQDAGDRSNDAIRVNANELTCLVVGEGGNLGFTQLARIEYELNGGSINTDFIDNSGGVDCSDHEVNIKILLDQIVAKGTLTEKNRNRLLAQMTDEVAQLVLHNNYRQVHAISIATTQSFDYINLYARFMKDYAKQGKIDRELEFLPDDDMLIARKAAGKGLTRPEIAVLQAYSKIILKTELIHSNLPLNQYIAKYIQFAFPKLLQRRYFAEMEHHRLRHEIIATQLSNLLITDMGVIFAYQMYDETRASPVEITRAYIISREIFNLQKYWDELDGLNIPTTSLTEITLEVVRLIRRSVRWFLRNAQGNNNIENTVKRFTVGIQNIQAKLPELLTEAEKYVIEQKINELLALGIPGKMAYRFATSHAISSALNIIEVATKHKYSLHKVATTYFALIDRLGLNEFRELIDNYPTDTHSMVLARSATKGDLDWIQRALTVSILKMNTKISNPQQRLDLWLEKNKVLIDRWQTVLTEMKASITFEYSMLVVAIRELLDLNKTSLNP
jgi:glutamate dehydrogenase